ncbi:unnamed protein product [Rotaria sordida]|uniref:G-protein coupled receptors family 1 profile domain-containing protein n=2 Tax=Rotaria sordida TaxID=392033 RepID=A0A814JUM3_9BILA|nr:unnamed protein product [Rotaria sordida]
MGLIWLVGNFGSTINCFIFYQPKLRKNPCVMYLLASSASQFLTFNFALLTRMLHFGYNIQSLNILLWYCKIRFYFFYILVAIPRYYIIFASVDRYFASSPDVYWRQWSSSKIAIRLIIGSCLFWCLIYIQVIVFYQIQGGGCSYRNGVYGIIFSVYISIESGILPPLMMLIFGFFTLNNIRKSKRTIRPLAVGDVVRSGQFAGMSRKDLQFSKMLFNQICLWIILNIPNPCYLLYQTITINDTKSPLRLTVESFISNMSYLLIYLEFSLTFFVYTLSSSLFRREFRQIIRHKILPRFPSNTTLRNNT